MNDLEQGQRSYLGVFFILAFGWAWSFWVPLSLEANGIIDIPPALSGFLMEGKPAAWGPLIAAVVVAALAGGKDELRRLFSSMVRVRFSVVWYLLAVLLLPTIVGLAQGIAWVMGDTIAPSEAFANPMSISISFVWIFFLGGPLQEEAGWRGTATPALEARLGALGASLLVGAFWALWHLPLFYQPRAEIYYNSPFWGLLSSTMLLSVLITWVYKGTGRSLFAAMVMHTSWNWANYLFTGLQTDNGGLAFLIILALVVVIVSVWFGPRSLCGRD